MIVKNESKIIERMLNSVIDIIDTYCISDTGSTDNTVEIITNFFKEKNISGKIIREEFKNFCFNRNIALTGCNGMSDYILLLDADMKLEINNFKKDIIGIYDEYNILQGSEHYAYYNKRIIKNNGLYKYHGVTHEYLSSSINAKSINLDKSILFINDIGDGGCKQNKFLRDIELLKQGIIDEPNNTRYYFYLGNSYFDILNNDEAIITYKELIKMTEGWVQEKYISCIRIYESYSRLKQEELGIHYLILSTKYDKNRIEGIYRLIKYYCIIKLDEIAYNFYSLIQNYFENIFYNKSNNEYNKLISNNLFCLQVEYKYYLPYYMIIVSERLKKYDIGIRMYEIIFCCNYLDAGEWWSNNLIFNLQFFIDKVDEKNISFFENCEKYINFLKNKYNIKHTDLLDKYEKYYNDITTDLNLSQEIKKYIIVADWLVNHIYLEPYLFNKKLTNLGWEIILLSKLDIKKLKNKKCIVMCCTFEDFYINNLKCKNIKLIYRIDDLHPYRDIKNHCIDNCDMLIAPYKYLFPKWVDKYKNILNKECYYNPHSAVNEFYNNIEFNDKPINKIFISGYINDTYPFRNYMINLAKDYDYIEILSHPSYELNTRKHQCINEEYYKKLNNFICCFTDSLCWNYVLLKVYEITSVGSLLLVTDSIEKQLNELDFYNETNCIVCNKENVIEKMNWILDDNNLEKINIIRKNGMNLTRQKHNTEERANLFNKYINELDFDLI